jgi:arylsulfatase A-like enzyme
MKRLLALLAATFTSAAPADAPRPNVIFVLCDDMGWGDLGVFYQNSRTSTEKFATPKLDTFANEGLQLRRHYAPAPVCAPSRASLILGVHQGHSNLRNNQFDQTLDDNHTLGTVMKGAGYATACIGKWGVQGPGTPANQPSHPSKRGFDYFFGYLSHLAAHYHYPEELTGNDNQGQPNAFFENTTNITAQLAKCYSTDLVTARAKKWIADQHTAAPAQPFFLYLTYAAPHAQLDVPTQAYPAGDGLDGGLQWTGTSGNMINTASGTINSWIHPDYASQAGWSDAAKRHATMMRRIDDSMGDLLATLDELGIDDNTLIVFTSDNGPANEAGSGGSFTHDPRFFGSYGPFEGIKRDVLEGGMRVPALVRWPAGIAAGGVSQIPTQFHDWLPTFAELAGMPQPERADGVSLVPTLTGTGTQRPSTVYAEYSYAGNTPNWTTAFPNHANDPRNEMQVLFLNGYKGIRTGIGSHADDFRIYDTLTDPAEAANLSGQAGVPTQQQLKDKVLQLRRANSGSARSYLDSQPVPPVTSPAVVNGIEWKAYEKATPWVPDWETETPAASGNASSPNLTVRTRDTDIGMLFSGYLHVPADGDYTFTLNTDTGAFVRLHALQLIDADFGYTGGTERSSGTINLKAGYHPLHIHYRHANAASHLLDLQWTGPGIAKQAIPASAYFREGIPVPVPPVANPDTTSTTGSTLIGVLANDTDDGSPSPLAIALITTPAHGTAVVEGTAIRYTPHNGFLGEDRFNYTITDGTDTATAPVSVTVVPATTSIWLPLDESAGTVAHDALGRPLGALANFPASPWIAGKLGNALTFDGNDDRVSLTGNKGITGTAARTVSFWINAYATQTSGTRPTMVSWGASNATGTGNRFDINLNHTSGYKLRSEFNSAGVNFTTPARSDLRGTGWVHCAIVMPANATVSQIQAYIDGVAATPVLEPTNSGTVAINTGNTNDVVIGRMADGTTARGFGGVIDDVRIFPEALDAARIAAMATETPEKNQHGAWYFRHSGNPSPTATDWSTDSDHDGFVAWLEYALGGNPTTGDTSIAPVFSQGVFRFNRRKAGIAPTSYHPQVSESLQAGSWTSLVDFTVSPHPDMPDFDIVSVPLPASTTPARFVRLEVDE